jgi:hypothetical protein
MSREYRTLKEVVHNLIAVSDVFESVRGKFSKYNKNDLLQAQEYLVASINCLKKGINSVDKGIQIEVQQQTEQQEADELEEAKVLEEKEQKENRGE